MSDPAPAQQPGAQAAAAAAPPKPPQPPARPQNPALRMMGLPSLPRRLPSRNWMIFWGVTAAFASAVIYDKREKNRATAKWRRAVAPLARETLSSPNQLPRKLTIYLEAPPGDGLRAAQDHFVEYVKPILGASGLDWEFVQGRQQGDVRAAIAEKIRRARRATERPGEDLAPTDESSLADLRKKMGLPEYEGIRGDIVVGRHTWKEYVRGLHEGWLGPLDPPALPPATAEASADGADKPPPATAGEKKDGEQPKAEDPKAEDKKPEEKDRKPERPPQPPPHNSPDDYASAALPATIPAEFSPSTAIPFPHRLGFSHTFVRLGRFLNRRKLADGIGRDVAAVCFGTAREWRSTDGGDFEQQLALKHEERDWVKSVWKEYEDDRVGDGSPAADGGEQQQPRKEKVWASPMVVDPRVAGRMRRFEISPEHEARAAEIVVPEEEVEGRIKGFARGVWRWGVSSFESKPSGPNVGNLDDE